jgi:hypothetical protein
MHELSSQAGVNGKGDKERSPGWRDHYDEIDFHREGRPVVFDDGFRYVGPGRIRKVYGPGAAKFAPPSNCGCGHAVCDCEPGHSGRTI